MRYAALVIGLALFAVACGGAADSNPGDQDAQPETAKEKVVLLEVTGMT